MNDGLIKVYGPEGCGNKIVKEYLKTDANIANRVVGTSLPKDRIGGKVNLISVHGRGIWETVDEILNDAYQIILINRSPVHSCYSAWRRFGEITKGGINTIIWQQIAARALCKIVKKECDRIGIICCTLNYDKLMSFPNQIKKLSDIENDFNNTILDSKDDERWKNDEKFYNSWIVNDFEKIFESFKGDY